MNGLLATINPGLVLILAGMLAAVTPVQRVRQGLALLAPVIATALLLAAPRETDLASLSMMGFDMVLYRVDSLSFIFGLAFLIAAFINAVYALHQDSQFEDTMGLTYMGAAVAAAFCGDFISLFVFWELTAITSVFLIFRSGTQAAYKAGMRYLGLHILSGVLLLPPPSFERPQLTHPNGAPIDLLALIPLHRAELDLKLEEGIDALVSRLALYNMTEVVDVDRPDVTRMP